MRDFFCLKDRMIRLDGNSKKLQIALGAAKSVNDCDVVVSFIDKTAAIPLGGSQYTTTNGTTLVDLCSAPTALGVREIDNVNVFNSDTVTSNVTISYVTATDSAKLIRCALLPNEQLSYTEGSGWKTLDANGSAKQSPAALSQTPWTAFTPTVTAGSGTITTLGAVSARYQELGKTVFVEYDITITTNGTGASSINVTYPNSAVPAANFVLHGREIAVTGSALEATFAVGGSTGSILTYANAYPGGNGNRLIVSGIFERA